MVKRLKYTKDLMAHMMASNASYIDKLATENDQGGAAFKTHPNRPPSSEGRNDGKLKDIGN
jgi:hypothetical protein